MNRRHNILISRPSILCVILAVTAMFVLQRRNRSVIYRIESTIVEQNEMLRKQAERQRLLYATLFLDPKLAETGRNTHFSAPARRYVFQLLCSDDTGTLQTWRSNLTFRYKPPEPIITMRHSGKRSAISNGEIVRPAMACLPEKRFLPTRR